MISKDISGSYLGKCGGKKWNRGVNSFVTHGTPPSKVTSVFANYHQSAS